jgi:hypothetical protein
LLNLLFVSEVSPPRGSSRRHIYIVAIRPCRSRGKGGGGELSARVGFGIKRRGGSKRWELGRDLGRGERVEERRY